MRAWVATNYASRAAQHEAIACAETGSALHWQRTKLTQNRIDIDLADDFSESNPRMRHAPMLSTDAQAGRVDRGYCT